MEVIEEWVDADDGESTAGQSIGRTMGLGRITRRLTIGGTTGWPSHNKQTDRVRPVVYETAKGYTYTRRVSGRILG